MYENDPYNYNYNPYEDPDENDRKRRKRLFIVILVICLGVIAGAAGVLIHATNQFVSRLTQSQEAAEEPSTRMFFGNETQQEEMETETETQRADVGNVKIPSTAILETVPADTQVVAEIAERALPSIVSITSTITTTYSWFGQLYSQEGTGAGSGIIIDQTDESLLILTNYHVVEDGKNITVTYVDDETSQAVIKGYDKDADLAVLSVPLTDLGVGTMDAIRMAKMGDSDAITMGEMVVAIGNALGYGQSVTVGYVSAKDRLVESDEGTKLALIQTDAAINPGNSGGALLNVKGEVIGINSVKYVDEDVEGMGFAIPITTAEPIIEELKSREILSDEEKGYVGIVGEDISEQMSQAYRMPTGIYVYSVTEDGPAARAGIVTGDIIFKINDSSVSTMEQLRA